MLAMLILTAGMAEGQGSRSRVAGLAPGKGACPSTVLARCQSLRSSFQFLLDLGMTGSPGGLLGWCPSVAMMLGGEASRGRKGTEGQGRGRMR
jgi:hypothetical protein